MPKYVIERDIHGAGRLSSQELQAISQKSCSVLGALGPQIQWLQSYVTGDRIYCVYIAPSEELVREHARQHPAVGVADQHVRRLDARAGEQPPEFGDLVACVTHAGRRGAVPRAGAVVGTRPRAAADLRLHRLRYGSGRPRPGGRFVSRRPAQGPA